MGSGTLHIKLLARIVMMLKNPASRDQLLAADNWLDLCRHIGKEDDNYSTDIY